MAAVALTGSGVTVLIAARDAATTLGATLDSLQRQRLPPERVVVVDDGSRDRTAAVAREHGADVVPTPSLGLPAARNAGLVTVTTRWVAVLDADDVFSDDHLRLLVDHAVATSADAVGVDAWYWVNGRVTPFTHFDCSRPPPVVPEATLLEGNPLLSTCLLGTAQLREVGGYADEVTALEDYDLWLRLVESGAVVVPAPRATMWYRREGGMTADAVAMYRGLEHVLQRRAARGRPTSSAPVARHAAVGAGNWAMVSGDRKAALDHWRRAHELGDRRRELAALRCGGRVAPRATARVLRRRLTVEGRPLPLQVVRWWRHGGADQPVVDRPDREGPA